MGMQARLCVKSDIMSINKWLKRRNHALVTESELPTTGFIVPGVAAGFVRKVEGNIGIFESVVSNALVSSSIRHKAMSVLFDEINNLNFKCIMGFTKEGDMLLRAKAAGYVHANLHALVIKRF